MSRAAAIPAVLLPALEAAESRYRDNGGSPERPPAAAADSMSRVWASSPFVAQNCAREPHLLEELASSGALNDPASPAARVKEALKEVADERMLMTRLRQVRRREMTRIAWRDLAGWADLAETLRDLSDLADTLTQGALTHLSKWHTERHGTARNAKGQPQQLVVLGLGKLGARELNFSSDIDLIFTYPEAGQSDGERPLDNEEYFLRLAQKLSKALDENTSDGFVFRVDLRLRPFGEAGPVALSFDAMETYYQSHGREWERYAFIKARPIAGDIKAGDKLLQELRPFVYRRYLDYGAFESLRDMKALLTQEVGRRGLSDNVKLGPGGIREIEFIGQMFQLIRGGREPQLRERGIVAVLTYLGSKNYLDPKDAEALLKAYSFLRRVENRLQEAGDQQVHDLPEDEVARIRLAFTMGHTDWASFRAVLDAERAEVHRVFESVVVAPKAVQEETQSNMVWADDAEAEAKLKELGFQDPKEAARVLHSLREASLREQGERSRRLYQAVLPQLVTAACEVRVQGTSPDEVLKRLARVIEAIAKRSAYLALLTENPTALRQLARLAAESVWLMDMVVRSPILLDELIDPRIFKEFPSQDSLHAELEGMLAGISPDDLEMQMDALRQFQQSAVVHAAAADLAGNAPLMKVSDFLTWTAEQVIRKALQIAWRQLVARHGRPQCIEHGRLRDARFAVVAYGKLGGWELGYGSDLDLVFLHDSRSAEQQTNGPRVLDNIEFFTRLAQRVINILSIPTTSGVLYQVDTRLRPSGASGLIVSSIDGFAQYQEQQAWTWEHQALLRARPVAGDKEVMELFRSIRRSVLGRERDQDKLKADIATMRARMREEQKHAGGDFDIKLDPGGLTDIEFMVQYAVLAHAHEHPSLLDWPDNIRNLEGLVATGVMPKATGDLLADSYREFRRRLHHLTLEGRPSRVPSFEVEPMRQQVRELWHKTLGPAA
ncbi:MAG TPA: bifunctional [glutamate--ammonia ligase]-adenylyl-L-tyrosine phosphorylase/[glutamate--ammonia-ligase] adenylyltransferase [Gammaproteobacteria bacterium]|jgi:glutamate-ammonia-ligase adenylyltransferase